MNPSNLYEVKVIVPNWYAKDYYNVEDYSRCTILNFGIISSTEEKIIDTFMSISKNKQDLFNNFKYFYETVSENKINFALKVIDVHEKSKLDNEARLKVKENYKLNIENLMRLFFSETNKYEYNLARNIAQNFVRTKDVIFNSGISRVRETNTVYEESTFEFTKECISIIPYVINYTEL